MITAQALVSAGLYPDERSVMQEAVRVLWQERPQLRIEWAIARYQHEAISLAKAAAFANVSFDRMKELLVQRGIQPRLGAETIAEALQELTALERAVARET